MEFNNQFNQFCGYIPIVCKKRQNPICSPCTRTKRKTCIPCPPCPTPSTTPSTNTNDEYNTPEENKPRRGPPIDKPVYVDDTPTIPRNMATGDDLIDKTISDFINIPQQTITDTNDNDDANSTWDTTTGIVKDVFLSENVNPPPVINPTDPPNPPAASWLDNITSVPHDLQWSNSYSNKGLTPQDEQLHDFVNLLPNPSIDHLLENCNLDWTDNDWDGSVFDVSEYFLATNGNDGPYLSQLLFNGNSKTMIGLKQLYEKIKPFSDKGGGDFTPSVPEMEEWFRQVILHFRRLIGSEIPLNGNPEYFLRSRWADEKKFTSIWNHYEPICQTYGGDAHCGFNFRPSIEEQQPYLDAATPPINNSLSGVPFTSEGMSGVNPMCWAVLPSYVIGEYVKQDGMIGHTRPFGGYAFAGHEMIGFSFSMYPNQNPNSTGNNYKFRNQWFIV